MDSALWETETDTAWLRYTTDAAGTYVAGLSTKPKEFELDAKSFDQYLADDGIPDILAARRKDGSLTAPVEQCIFAVSSTDSRLRISWYWLVGAPG